ncbi:hypothetical protein [Mycolicibacterium phlei]|uniref:hypothetical protein n=2 Tax=Mycolicibacterium phlei TaxID=1771 RepID=UPI00030C1E71|nr:hypothetical protein [Mycolicibacterium phlei]
MKIGDMPYRNLMIISSSLKNYTGEIQRFIEWISPHLDMNDGDFLGYSLYEANVDERERPMLYFHDQEPVQT